MIFLIGLALWVIFTKRLNVTRKFRLEGNRARAYGITLLVVLLPFKWFLAFIFVILTPLVPPELASSLLANTLVSITFMMALTLGLAWFFRSPNKASAPGGTSDSMVACASCGQRLPSSTSTCPDCNDPKL